LYLEGFIYQKLSSMKSLCYLILLTLVISCNGPVGSTGELSENPFLTALNEPIDYASVSAEDIGDYAGYTLGEVQKDAESIRNLKSATFDNVFGVMDEIHNKINIASNNCFMLYWVSTDSLSRLSGLKGYQLLDSLSTTLYSDRVIFDQMVRFSESKPYQQLEGNRKILVDDLILRFKQSGVNLEAEELSEFKRLSIEISQLSSDYSNNMNASNELLTLDEAGVAGLPENFMNTYRVGDSQYEIPIMNATSSTVLGNADSEETRKAYYFLYANRAEDKNLEILDKLVQKRYELAQIMGYDSYAEYNLFPKMANNPATVWNFINDLVDRSKEKAIADLKILEDYKKQAPGNGISSPLYAWDISYYKNQILKTEYQVDHEKLREYLPMEQVLDGMLEIYEQLLGLDYRRVENPSVWHEDVQMYEVFEGEELRGRFYLDLFPRPNKESWFYGVGLTDGKLLNDGYEVPVCMLLGNFTKPTDELPSLLSHRELNTLFHEFGHIMDNMCYRGEFALQAYSKPDFAEAMSQIFENWTWDYTSLSRVAIHYETGEVLPRDTFDKMFSAKNFSSGYSALSSLRSCIYDMNLYDSYDPKHPISTDDLWVKIDEELGVREIYVEGTHPQASWIHINTHPVYYYGYLWAEVYAQDLFTEFEKNGLTDQATGIRYRQLILANGTQRDLDEAVEEFLGRPSNNEAYIRSLGLE